MGFEHRVTILFRVGEDRVEILRILYGGRDIGPQLEKF
jgi:plasmid stabilization system protein ParE